MDRRSFLKSLLAVTAAAAASTIPGSIAFARALIPDADKVADASDVGQYPVRALAVDTWQHIAFTREANILKVYLNGERVQDIVGAYVECTGNTVLLHVGSTSMQLCGTELLAKDYTIEAWVNPIQTTAYADEVKVTSVADDQYGIQKSMSRYPNEEAARKDLFPLAMKEHYVPK